MFEIGKRYKFTVLEGTVEGIGPSEEQWTVEAIDGALLKLKVAPATVNIPGHKVSVPGREKILNTASAYFVSAVPV